MSARAPVGSIPGSTAWVGTEARGRADFWPFEPIRFRGGTTEVSEAATYASRSGGIVFAAGTVQWSWGLDDWGVPALRPSRRHPDAERITLNVIDALGGGGAPMPSARSPR